MNNIDDVVDKIRTIDTIKMIKNDIAKMIKNLNIKHVMSTVDDNQCFIIASNKKKMNWNQEFGYNKDEIRIFIENDLKVGIDVPFILKPANKYVLYKSTLGNPKVFNDIKRIVKKHFKDFTKLEKE